ncbi:hypothetical protein [Streptococcus suis]|uniref:hypothetical protein n=1 Tax=Streptococcus suis TaxID=1307 RepID=UPI0013BE91AA|nr:hypothetical protein [Streptococcus suis]
MILVVVGVFSLGGSLFVVSMLYANLQIRYRNGYDDELEGDYQTLMEQQRK